MWEAFEDSEVGCSGLRKLSWERGAETGGGRTVLRSPVSLAREARSHSASTLVGSRLHTLR